MPALPSLATQVRGLDLPERLVRAVEELQQFLRVRGGLLPGDKLDEYISRRDLIAWGFATAPAGVPVPVTGGGTVDPGGGGGEPTPDYTPPPTPANLVATAGYTAIFLYWDQITDPRIGFFEVWRASVDNIGSAVKIGQTTSFSYIDKPPDSSAYYYWVRAVNAWDNDVTSPFNAVAGTEAQTAPDVAYLLDILTGELGDQPFFEITVPTVIGGVTFDPGVYMKAIFAKKAIAETFVAGLAVIDDASIVNVRAGKILADKLGVGQYIEAQNYVAGASGWRINANGTAEFSGVVVRGTVYASAGLIGGLVIGSTYVQSAGYVAGTSGFRLNSDGSVEIRNLVARGDILASSVAAGISVTAPQIIGGTVQAAAMFGGSYSASYAWPASNTGGFHLSPSGILLGNWNGSSGNYAYIDAQGNAGFSNVTARGNIEASTLKVNAANIVSTLHLQGEAVTIPRSLRQYLGTGSTASISVDSAEGTRPILIWGMLEGAGLVASPCQFTVEVYYSGAWRTTGISGVGTAIPPPSEAGSWSYTPALAIGTWRPSDYGLGDGSYSFRITVSNSSGTATLICQQGKR